MHIWLFGTTDQEMKPRGFARVLLVACQRYSERSIYSIVPFTKQLLTMMKAAESCLVQAKTHAGSSAVASSHKLMQLGSCLHHSESRWPVEYKSSRGNCRFQLFVHMVQRPHWETSEASDPQRAAQMPLDTLRCCELIGMTNRI